MQINFFNEWLANDFTRAFAWTLIHSLWQGFAAAIIAGLIIFCTKRSTAVLRYNLLSAVFFLFIAAAYCTFFITYNSYNDSAVTSQASVQVNGLPAVTTSTTPTAQPFYKSFGDSFRFYFEQNAPLVVVVWFMVFIVQCLKLFSGFYYVQRLRRSGLSAPPDEWKEKLQALCNTLGIRQTVLFMQSEIIKIPLVLGYLKPLILVPVGILNNLPAEQVETILLHELAHIRRKDYFVNLLQSIAETVFFFNPAIRWISGIIREEREACCDDIVVDYTSNKTTYLQALVNFNDYRNKNNGYAMALAGRRTSLLNRVKRMLTYENNKLNIMEKVILVSGFVVITAFSMVNTKEIKVLSAPAVLTSSVVEQIFKTEQPPKPPVVLLEKKEIKTSEEIHIEVPDAAPVNEDTLPATRSKYRHVYTNTNNNGTTKTSEVVIEDENGKSYRIKKSNDKITEFFVNDVRVSETEMGAYKTVLEEIDLVMKSNWDRAAQRAAEAKIRGEEARVRGEEAKIRGEEAKVRGEEARMRGEEARIRSDEARKLGEEAKVRGEEARKRGEEARVRSEGAMKRGEEARARGEESMKRGEEARVRGEEAMKRGEEARVRGEEAMKRGEEARVRGEEAMIRGEEARKRGEETQKQVKQIIDELIKENVISNTDNLSITLSNNILIVNGIKQSDALHNKLKKFSDKDGGVITFKKSGDSTSTSINKD